MYPVLILRTEVVCLLVLLYLLLNAKRYQLGRKDKTFSLLLVIAFVHVLFDAITVISVNNQDIISPLANTIFHVIFYVSAMGFTSLYLDLIIKMFYPKFKSKLYIPLIILVLYAVSIFTIPAMKINYEDTLKGTFASTGIAAYIGFAYAYLCIIVGLALMVINKNKIKENVMYSLFPISITVVLVITIQIFERSFLATGIGVTLLTVGLFFSNENPAQVLQQRNIVEALDSLKTNNDFYEDLKKYNEEYANEPKPYFAFVKCVINNLAEINNQLGHSVGDDYISLIISKIASSFTNALAFYRFSGSEIMIVYKNVDEKTIATYIKTFYSALLISKANLPYEPNASCGFAGSNENFHTLEEVVKAIDYSVYVSKQESKGGNELFESKGLSVETAGLNDYLYEAMLVGDKDDHPYILNLKTNVMRITPKWRDDFGLTNDVMYDLPSVWISHIHPDDRQAFIDDFTATVNGTQKEHHCDYRSMDKDGVYRNCSCHGGVFTTFDGTVVFAGHMYVKNGDTKE